MFHFEMSLVGLGHSVDWLGYGKWTHGQLCVEAPGDKLNSVAIPDPTFQYL